MTKRKYAPREFDINEHVLPVTIDGKTITMHTITLWLRERSYDDDALQSRYTSYIKSNAEQLGARKYVGNWMLPATIEITLPPAGTKRSTWGVGINRVIVGLTDEQLDIVVNQWHCRVRVPTNERANVKLGLNRDGTPKSKSKSTTMTTATATAIANDPPKQPRTLGDHRDGITASELIKTALQLEK